MGYQITIRVAVVTLLKLMNVSMYVSQVLNTVCKHLM